MTERDRSAALPALALLSVSFLTGAVVGTLAEGQWTSDGTVTAFLSSAQPPPALWREAWTLLRWPLLALLAGTLPFTGVVLPGLFCLRGFLLSYGIAALTAGNGGAGWLAGLALFLPACLLTLPPFFLLGVEGLLRKVEERPKGRRLLLLAGSAPPLLLCALADGKLTPALLGAFLR